MKKLRALVAVVMLILGASCSAKKKENTWTIENQTPDRLRISVKLGVCRNKEFFLEPGKSLSFSRGRVCKVRGIEIATKLEGIDHYISPSGLRPDVEPIEGTSGGTFVIYYAPYKNNRDRPQAKVTTKSNWLKIEEERLKQKAQKEEKQRNLIAAWEQKAFQETFTQSTLHVITNTRNKKASIRYCDASNLIACQKATAKIDVYPGTTQLIAIQGYAESHPNKTENPFVYKDYSDLVFIKSSPNNRVFFYELR